MEQALRLYKERTKAIGYVATNITANKSKAFEESNLPEIRQPSTQQDYNELNIRIVRCSDVQARRESKYRSIASLTLLWSSLH